MPRHVTGDDTGTVTTDMVEDLAVTTDKIDDAAVTTVKIDDAAVTTAKVDDLAVTTDKIDDAAVTLDKIASGIVVAEITHRVDGEITVSSDLHRYYVNRAFTITGVRASVGVSPVDAELICDVNLNGVTIFTTQSGRPQIVSGGYTDVSDTPDVVDVVSGDYFTFDVDQVGSSSPGEDLTIQVFME